jgi:hypothetical protein
LPTHGSCIDGEKSAMLGETDVDCGGGQCPRCDTGLTCIVDSDCLSDECLNFHQIGICNSPHPTPVPTVKPTSGSCTDGVLNVDETDVDCGGATCRQCTAGESCKVDTDCLGGLFCVPFLSANMAYCQSNSAVPTLHPVPGSGKVGISEEPDVSLSLLPAALQTVVHAAGAIPTVEPTIASTFSLTNFDDIIGMVYAQDGMAAEESLKVNTQATSDVSDVAGNAVLADSPRKFSLQAGLLMGVSLVAAVLLVVVLRRSRVSAFRMEGVRSMVGYSGSGSGPQLHMWSCESEGRARFTPTAEAGSPAVGTAGQVSSSNSSSRAPSRGWRWGDARGAKEMSVVQAATAL